MTRAMFEWCVFRKVRKCVFLEKTNGKSDERPKTKRFEDVELKLGVYIVLWCQRVGSTIGLQCISWVISGSRPRLDWTE